MIYRVLELLVVGGVSFYQLVSPTERRARRAHAANLAVIGTVVRLSNSVRAAAQSVAKLKARADLCGSDAAESAEAQAVYTLARGSLSVMQRMFGELKSSAALRLAPGYELPHGI